MYAWLPHASSGASAERRRVFEPVLDADQEAGGIRTVDSSMVGTQCECQNLSLCHGAIDEHKARPACARGEDGDLRRVDDRGEGADRVHAEVADREGAL